MHIGLVEEALDFAVATCCKYAKWLNIKGKRACFLIWFACSIYWFVVDLQRELYSQAFFCILTACFQAYGFYEWKRKRFGEDQQSTSPLNLESQPS